MSNFTHPDLDWTFTHYIAPLMGNFDTIGNDSHILYKDDGKLADVHRPIDNILKL